MSDRGDASGGPSAVSSRELRRRRLIDGAACYLAGMATVVAAGLAVIATGAFDASASAPHIRLVGWALRLTMINSVRARAAPLPLKAPLDPAEVRAGFRIYDRECAPCHGGPGVARDRWVSGLTPTPPYLIDASRRWTPGELYWIVRNGVKMTAMPAWCGQRSDAELRSIMAFLATLPTLTPQAYARLRAAEPAPPAVQTPPAASC